MEKKRNKYRCGQRTVRLAVVESVVESSSNGISQRNKARSLRAQAQLIQSETKTLNIEKKRRKKKNSVGHPENELTTAKENPKCKQTYKTKIENSEKKNNKCDAFSTSHRCCLSGSRSSLLLTAIQKKKKAIKREREKVQFVIQSSVHRESLWGYSNCSRKIVRHQRLTTSS
ncbi:hypothetical protein TNCV_291181 [Trichonephila clavipes]|nr:hypothetical protein TNCV_291181 [Trichonephila clavipes]